MFDFEYTQTKVTNSNAPNEIAPSVFLFCLNCVVICSQVDKGRRQ